MIAQRKDSSMYKYRESETGKVWACKCVPAKLDFKAKNKLKNELSVLKALSHPGILNVARKFEANNF